MGHLYHGYVSHNQMVRLGFQSGMTAGSTGLCVALMAWWCPKTCRDDGGESTNLKHGMPISKWDVLAVLATNWRIHSWNLEFNNLDLTHTFFFQSWSATLENTLIKFGMNTKNTNPKKEGIRRKVAYNKQCNGEPQFLVSEPWEFLENAKVVFPDSVNPMTLYQSRIWTGEDHLQKIKPLKRLQAFGPFNKKNDFSRVASRFEAWYF